MTPRLGFPPASEHHPYNPEVKNVDEAPKAQGFSGFDFSRFGHLGDGLVRDTLRKNFKVIRRLSAEADAAEKTAGRIPSAPIIEKAEAARKAADDAARAFAELLEAAEPSANEDIVEAARARFQAEQEANAKWRAKEFEDLADEETGAGRVAYKLPDGLGKFLRAMTPARRKEREAAILKKVGWEGVGLVGLDPTALTALAENKVHQYVKKFPCRDEAGNPINDAPEHRKGRCQKWQLRRLRKLQRKALLYIEQAVGAVGGREAPGRPLYISDYGLEICREEDRRTEEVLEGLRLLKKADPSVQIPMIDLHWKAKAADAAKRRLLIDVHLARWKALGWSVCWLTVVLPAEYVANATNEGYRVTEWNPMLGPEEAGQEIQDKHHGVLALLRERGVRLTGWWNVQPQQSGAPHKHYVVACPTVEDARTVCDEFHEKFKTGTVDEDGQDRGCAAFVIGDEEGGHAPRKGKNGKDETAESVARYAARYATRYATRPDAKGEDDGEGEGVKDGSAGGDELVRFRGWKKLRRARGMAFLGLDSKRAPLELWDILLVNAMKEDDRHFRVEDARMSIAMREMRISMKFGETAGMERAVAKAAREVLTVMKAAKDSISAEELEAAEAAVAEPDAAAKAAADKAAFHGWHAAVSMGVWPDRDLDPVESAWLSEAVQEWNRGRWELPDGAQRDTDPLPPVPLRETRVSTYGEEREEIRGAIGVAKRFTLSQTTTRAELYEVAESLGINVERPKAKLRRQHVFDALETVGIPVTWREKKLTLQDLLDLAARLGATVHVPDIDPTKGTGIKALKAAGFGFSKRPDGSIVGFDLSGEILLRSDDEWIIVEKGEAERMRGEEATARSHSHESEGLSFSATYPRLGPDGPHHEGEGPPG